MVLLVSSAVAAGVARGDQPPSLPGPPPGAGTGFPAAPAPGTVPVAGPGGPATTIRGSTNLPGLLDGTVVVPRSGQFTLQLACSADGGVAVAAPGLASGRIASGRYACRGHRASLRFRLRGAAVKRLDALGSVLAQATLGRGRLTSSVSLTLRARSAAAGFWTDGGLECDLLGFNESYIAAPNFTVRPPAIIDVRPWVAVFTSRSGWQWVGTLGPGHSAWYRWTATPSGVQEWYTPAGALNPWTWAPIAVRPAGATYAIGAFEIVYRYTHPVYQWRYIPSYASSSPASAFCRYS